MSIEQLKRRVESLAPAPEKDYPKSAWDRMSAEEKRADCRKWIKVWTNRHPEDLQTEEETEAMITRLIEQVDCQESTHLRTQEPGIAVSRMSDEEIEKRAGEILRRAR